MIVNLIYCRCLIFVSFVENFVMLNVVIDDLFEICLIFNGLNLIVDLKYKFFKEVVLEFVLFFVVIILVNSFVFVFFLKKNFFRIFVNYFFLSLVICDFFIGCVNILLVIMVFI